MTHRDLSDRLQKLTTLSKIEAEKLSAYFMSQISDTKARVTYSSKNSELKAAIQNFAGNLISFNHDAFDELKIILEKLDDKGIKKKLIEELKELSN